MQAQNYFWNPDPAPLNIMQPIGDNLHDNYHTAKAGQYNDVGIERYIDPDHYERDRFDVLRPNYCTSTTGHGDKSIAELVGNIPAGTPGEYSTPRSFQAQPALSFKSTNIPNEKYQAKKQGCRKQLAECRSTIQDIEGVTPLKKENTTYDLDYWHLGRTRESFKRDLDQNSIFASIVVKHSDAAPHLAAFMQKVKDSVDGSSHNNAPIRPYADLQRSLDIALTAMQALPGLATPVANIGLRGLDWRLSILSHLLDSAAVGPLYEYGVYNECLHILAEFVGHL